MPMDLRERPLDVQPVSFPRVAEDQRGPARSVRVDAERWASFDVATSDAGYNRNSAILQFIRWYLREPGARLPQRPDGPVEQ